MPLSTPKQKYQPATGLKLSKINPQVSDTDIIQLKCRHCQATGVTETQSHTLDFVGRITHNVDLTNQKNRCSNQRTCFGQRQNL